MFMKKALFSIVAIVSVACFCGCGTTIQYGDATSSTPLSTDYGSSDLQQTANAMVDSMLNSPAVAEITAGGRPILVMDTVRNKTMQHIDTESITDSIRTKLIQSRKFSFVDATARAAMQNELSYQNASGMVDPTRAIAFGQQYGAEFLVTANLSEIKQSQGRVSDVYYKFTMNLQNLKTGIIEWADEKEIRKVRTRALLGG
jgi:uncharacterized protein (TIGR02722 family)